jgi:hypothetical protein
VIVVCSSGRTSVAVCGCWGPPPARQTTASGDGLWEASDFVRLLGCDNRSGMGGHAATLTSECLRMRGSCGSPWPIRWYVTCLQRCFLHGVVRSPTSIAKRAYFQLLDEQQAQGADAAFLAHLGQDGERGLPG